MAKRGSIQVHAWCLHRLREFSDTQAPSGQAKSLDSALPSLMHLHNTICKGLAEITAAQRVA